MLQKKWLFMVLPQIPQQYPFLRSQLSSIEYPLFLLHTAPREWLTIHSTEDRCTSKWDQMRITFQLVQFTMGFLRLLICHHLCKCVLNKLIIVLVDACIVYICMYAHLFSPIYQATYATSCMPIHFILTLWVSMCTNTQIYLLCACQHLSSHGWTIYQLACKWQRDPFSAFFLQSVCDRCMRIPFKICFFFVSTMFFFFCHFFIENSPSPALICQLFQH